jgi:hypothetical protein
VLRPLDAHRQADDGIDLPAAPSAVDPPAAARALRDRGRDLPVEVGMSRVPESALDDRGVQRCGLSAPERTGANVRRGSTSWGLRVRAQYRPFVVVTATMDCLVSGTCR